MDIVERLREWNVDPSGMEEAADEIERLREENEKLKDGSRVVVEKQSWEAFQTGRKCGFMQ